MKNILFLLFIPLFFVSCEKDEVFDVPKPLIATMEGTSEMQLVLRTEKLFESSGYQIATSETSRLNKQAVRLKYIYKRFPSDTLIPSPAYARIYATAEPEQVYVIKYKNSTANLTVKYDGTTFSIDSDNVDFIRGE